jgi:endonuclease-3
MINSTTFKLASQREVELIKEKFLANYEKAKSELNYTNLYELIVSVMLSAQCTDKRVNLITPALFKRFPNTKSLARASLDDVCSLIETCSYFNNKAKNLIKMAQMVESDYDGEIPLIKEELVKLAGVGNKTANVVLIEYLDANLMAVDTHVFRVSHRLGLSYGKNVTETEKDLVEKFKTDLNVLHQALVLFGRYVCKAKNPDCESCDFIKFCKTKEQFKAK